MTNGDSVAVIDDDISGKVIFIGNDVVTILTSDGFEMEYAMNELVVVDDAMHNLQIGAIDVANYRNIEKESKSHKKSLKNRVKTGKIKPLEVDLHINQLIKSTKGLDNYDMLNIQMNEAKRQLEFAINKRIQRIVFIHGVGEGVLRTELEFLFKRYDNIKYYDADYHIYGRGATEVYVFQNRKN